MANRWGSNGHTDRLYFGGSQITADGDCSHEITPSLRSRRPQANRGALPHRPARPQLLLPKTAFQAAVAPASAARRQGKYVKAACGRQTPQGRLLSVQLRPRPQSPYGLGGVKLTHTHDTVEDILELIQSPFIEGP